MSWPRATACLAVALAYLSLAGAGPARALITPPVTVDGPSSAILDFGGVSVASDGSGGLVYVKAVAGTPHVFVCRFVGGAWSAPIRVDWDQPYEAGQPRIAAGPKGELLVVWVTEVATVHGKVQYGLFSARVGAGGSSFGPSLPVDPNVGEGQGVDPSISATSPGKAIVAYRAITYAFPPNTFSTAVQLRPGDVMADVRVARFSGDRWARIGAVNRDSETSTRAPSPTNGPQVGTGLDGGAVVAWQEPDQTGAARIWMRRIFGTTPGPVLQASPSSWESKPVSADADAFSLSVTPYAMAQVALRVGKGAGSALAGRLLLNTLPAAYSTTAGTLGGAQLADGGATGTVGPADVATTESANKTASTRLSFLVGSRLRQMGSSGAAALSPIAAPSALPAQAGAAPVVSSDPAGGGLTAYPALDQSGLSTVAVRQEFPSGAAQSGLVSGVQGGPISELSIGRSGAGDGVVAFRQGEPGRYEVVAERVSVPPAAFKVEAPKGWVKPTAAKLRWEAAASAVGGLTYAVLIDGRPVKRGLRRRLLRLPAAQLGSGVLRAQVLAVDGLGQQLLSRAAKLRVDGQPPVVRIRERRGAVTVSLRDRGSGLGTKQTEVSFGDGERARGGARFQHVYGTPGRYRILVHARDKAGNRLVRGYEVRVP